ncbi:N-acetylmuramoyl-L-alanine amidase [Nocardia thailandica]|uniref:N-acetylmuramoyl-L-alanine amidase n=1 Tax=Nocardia thailandica TaxID=257275 RepID=UPI00031CE226|nr:N-acetylmuramoyl-L-alanine amidase [Nocardia thailandica]
MTRPDFTEIDAFGNSRSSRWGARVTNFLLHTQEGNGSAESLAGYLNNPDNGVSYHYTVRDGIVCNVVDTDYASWSVLDANSQTINLCFAGSRSAWSRQQWLAIDRDLRIAAYLAVEDARKYKFATTVITPPYRRADGISDHRYVTDALGIGDHTDVGPNFPWDVFAGYVAEYAGGTAPAPVRNEIDAKAAVSPWLGKRLTVGENTCPDKIGKWAQFERGYIYWSPATGAHPIPDTLWDKFAGLGWEAGGLGYPTTDHTVLKGPDGANWGDVQGFQRGAVYRRYGQPAYWVHGAIRDHWNRSGFENGKFGWPVSDEQPFDGAAYQDFERGRIHWTPKPTLGLLTAGDRDTPLPDAA